MNLPTIDVTQEQADQIIAAFGGEQNYLAWLTSSVNSFVLSVEGNNLRSTRDEEIAQELEAIAQSLPEVPGVGE